jgi:UDP-glucose-4-epimerase GalE
MNNKIIVTGGAGYIGSHICKELKKKKFQPIVLDNFSSGLKNNIKWGKYYNVDLNNKIKLNKILKKEKPAAIIHMAGNIEAGESLKKISTFYKNNVLGTYNLLESMSINKIKFIVFSSSAAIYGNVKKTPITENFNLKPENVYGSTKLIGEEIIKNFSDAKKINFCNLRYFNVGGPDSEMEIGENLKPETHLIPLLIEAIIRKKQFNLYGNNYNTKDGTCIRDYVHVEDIANAHILALKKILKLEVNDSINLGSGIGYSVKQIIKETEKQLKSKTNIKINPRRNGDPEKLTASIKLAKKKINWYPKKSIHDIISSAIKYYLKINNLNQT